MRPDHPEHDHAHPHDHNHAHGPHPTREDDDVVLSYGEARFLALKGLLIGKGIITADEVRRQHEINERGTPHQGARMVAKAWVDPAFKARMLKDAKAAAIELGIEVTEAELMAIENTPTCHNIIVCTLCSCYPRSLLGEPPAWYVSKAYRSRAVREPRKVLREFGLSFPDAVEVRVHDSNADLRYVVLPLRPRGRLMTETHSALDKSFRLEEATIDELHQAIKSGQTTCVEIVKQYIDRVCAFNGVASMLVTKDGAPIQEAPGMVRGKGQIHFPTKTVKASEVLPDLDKYRGQPIEFGRMETTASDPAVLQQFGMIVGIPKAGQLNALATLNIRGERSVTCRGDFDKPVSEGPLPPGAPAVCEILRRMPDALEQAAELDAAYGRTPDLEKMPMYGVVFSFKDPFDTKDMRSTGGGDARYDVDFPARDHVLVEQLRNKGAIIFAKAVNTEYNGRPDAPDGRHAPVKVLPSVTGYQRSTWGGNPGNPYDTTRAASLGSSSGSAVSVSANLVMCSLGEETRASCRGPANHNAVALILPHKAMLGFDGGAIGADIYCDRSGILARTLADCAQVLDALRDPGIGYYDPRDVYTTVPRSSVLANYASHAAPAPSLKGMRIGIVRESMLLRPGDQSAEPISRAAAAEIKAVLGGKLGATLVESGDPLWEPDRDLEPMNPDFRRALARLAPVFMPDLLFRLGRDGARDRL